jgi:hypothetical protein
LDFLRSPLDLLCCISPLILTMAGERRWLDREAAALAAAGVQLRFLAVGLR